MDAWALLLEVVCPSASAVYMSGLSVLLSASATVVSVPMFGSALLSAFASAVFVPIPKLATLPSASAVFMPMPTLLVLLSMSFISSISVFVLGLSASPSVFRMSVPVFK